MSIVETGNNNGEIPWAEGKFINGSGRFMQGLFLLFFFWRCLVPGVQGQGPWTNFDREDFFILFYQIQFNI